MRGDTAVSSSTFEMRSARVKEGFELIGPEVDLSILMLANCARLYSTLVLRGSGGVWWGIPRDRRGEDSDKSGCDNPRWDLGGRL